MTFSHESAGGRAATDSAAQSGQHVHLAAHRGVSPVCLTVDSADEVLGRLRGVICVAEAQAANLRETQGCEIDRADMIAVFDLIERELRKALDVGNLIEREVQALVEAGAQGAQA